MDYCPFSNVCLAYGCHFWLMGCCVGVYVPLTLVVRSLFSVYGLFMGYVFGLLAVVLAFWLLVLAYGLLFLAYGPLVY